MRTLILSFALAVALVSPVRADESLREAVQDYMGFATYEAGILLPQQLDETVFRSSTIIDTRDAEQYAAGHIPGALNIEWREIQSRLKELPETGLVFLYCNTGTLSSQATFAARLLGRENFVVLQGGIKGWAAEAAWKPE